MGVEPTTSAVTGRRSPDELQGQVTWMTYHPSTAFITVVGCGSCHTRSKQPLHKPDHRAVSIVLSQRTQCPTASWVSKARSFRCRSMVGAPRFELGTYGTKVRRATSCATPQGHAVGEETYAVEPVTESPARLTIGNAATRCFDPRPERDAK